MANPAGAVSAWPGSFVLGWAASEIDEAPLSGSGLRRIIMHAVIRKYTGSPGVVDEARPKFAHLEQTMRGMPGFVAYYFLETADGVATITIAEDEAGTTESMGRAANWVQQNLESRAALGVPRSPRARS